MKSAPRPRIGFSLPELLVVVGIVALLIAILIPLVSKVQKMSRSTVCLSNLRQWGQSFQMYINDNHGKSIPAMVLPRPIRWFEALAPYNSAARRSLLCPEARQPRNRSDPNGVNGSATTAWWMPRGDWAGSYGFNQWVYKHSSLYYDPSKPIRFPVRDGERIPLLGDCCWAWDNPESGDAVPRNLEYPEEGIGRSLAVYCIDRHQMAINVVFLDGHADHEPLAELWKLKWSENFVPEDVVVPKP